MSKSAQNAIKKDGDLRWLETIVQQVNSLRFGVVEIVVRDSQVTRIEKIERHRLDKPTTEIRPNRNE